MTLSVIIPTKNRYSDLIETVRALLVQTRMPDELIVVDQSASNECGPALTALLKGSAIRRFIHVWDRSINGLPMARNVGFAESTGDIVCYLDDDTTPDPGYLATVERGFNEFAEWAGICPAITETETSNALRRLAGGLFRVGIFKDDRARLAETASPRPSRLLPGAACSFRRLVLERFNFDETLVGYGLGEDVEFCLRAGREFQFGVYPAARVHHRRSSAGRPDAATLRAMARSSANRLWRAHRRHIGDDLAYLWLFIGFGTEQILTPSTKPAARLEMSQPAAH